MCVAADARHAAHAEVEGREGPESRLLDERHDERAQAAVDMQADVVPVRKVAEGGNIVGIAVREVDRGADELDDG